MNWSSIREKIQRKYIEYKVARETLLAERKALKEAKERLDHCLSAQALVQDVAQQVQEQVHAHIARVVSLCLETIFDEPYYFQIHFERKRGRTEARLVFEKHGNELDPMFSTGGGVIDVASFALRLACLLLSRPSLRPIMILDEPFKNVSKAEGYLDKIPDLLISLSEKFNVQFIMITHIEELKIGDVYVLEG